MAAGVRRVLRLSLPSPIKAAERSVDARARLVLAANPDGSLLALIDDCADAAVDALLAGELPWTHADFAAVRDRIRAELLPRTVEILTQVRDVLTAAHEARAALSAASAGPSTAPALEDVKNQFRRLLPTGFVSRAGAARLPDLGRYLKAVSRRLELLPRDPSIDRARMERVRVVQQAYDDLVSALPPARAAADDVRDIAWQIEELRVSLWAQTLGTPRPVSEKRIFRALDAITA
jgi:ATP-dependent helicase HrpA